jgi:pilus assembly protein Flp/PilA
MEEFCVMEQRNLRRLARRRGRGQGLPEYALILVLVAVVSVVILSVLGPAVQRIFGLTAGSLGGRGDVERQYSIVIEKSFCLAVDGPTTYGSWRPGTGLEVKGTTNAPNGALTGSTWENYGTGIDELGQERAQQVDITGSSFKWSPRLLEIGDVNGCPAAVTIQSQDGSLAYSYVERGLCTVTGDPMVVPGNWSCNVDIFNPPQG